jgi:secondary thiamine-phosphate synthase enzyme
LKVLQQERRSFARAGFTVTDITADVRASVRDSGVRNGIACVYSPGTTSCIRVNEFETGLLEDFGALLERLLAHDAHCLSMLLGPPGESIPVADGELLLGRWQRVLFLELGAEQDARWHVEVVGTRGRERRAPAPA